MSNWAKAGLLEDDGSSQISSIDSMERDSSDGSVGSSLSSVAALRQAHTHTHVRRHYNPRLQRLATRYLDDFARMLLVLYITK